MEDIAPALLKKIQSSFRDRFSKNSRINDLYALVRGGQATYQQAQGFAEETGRILSEAFFENINSGMLPNGRMYYNIANRIIPPMLENNYNLAADIASQVQDFINQSAGLNIKAVRPALNQNKIQGIVDIVSGKEKYDEIAYMLKEPIINFTQCVVDDTVKINADIQYMAGMSPKIVRTSTGKCCEWCDRLDGVYDYESVRNTGNDVFRRHKSCRCLVEFVPDKSRVQNVHSKKWANREDIDTRIKNSFAKKSKINRHTRAQAEMMQESLKKEKG